MKRKKILAKIKNSELREFAIKIIDYLEENLSEYRVKHSFKVVKYCLVLAKKSGNKVNRDKIILAALIHDITKEKEVSFHYAILKRHNVKNYKSFPNLILHSKTASLFVEETFGFYDLMVSKAVLEHTVGSAIMVLFSKVLFAADYLANLSKDGVRYNLELSINRICLKKIQKSLFLLIKKENKICLDSIKAYNSFIEGLL